MTDAVIEDTPEMRDRIARHLRSSDGLWWVPLLPWDARNIVVSTLTDVVLGIREDDEETCAVLIDAIAAGWGDA